MDVSDSYVQRPREIQVISDIHQKIQAPWVINGTRKRYKQEVARICEIKTLDDVWEALQTGAQKVVMPVGPVTAEVIELAGPDVVLVVVIHNNKGYQPNGDSAVNGAKKAQAMGAREVVLYNVERKGTMKGLDMKTIIPAANSVPIPVWGWGGMGGWGGYGNETQEDNSNLVAVIAETKYCK